MTRYKIFAGPDDSQQAQKNGGVAVDDRGCGGGPNTSSYSCYTNGTTAQNADMFAQVRGGVFTPLANASALIPLLAHIVCPVAHPSQEMVGRLCAAGVGLQVKRQAKVHEDLSGFTESCVGACPRWPVGQ